MLTREEAIRIIQFVPDEYQLMARRLYGLVSVSVAQCQLVSPVPFVLSNTNSWCACCGLVSVSVASAACVVEHLAWCATRGARRERRYAPMLIHADDLVVL